MSYPRSPRLPLSSDSEDDEPLEVSPVVVNMNPKDLMDSLEVDKKYKRDLIAKKQAAQNLVKKWEDEIKEFTSKGFGPTNGVDKRVVEGVVNLDRILSSYSSIDLSGARAEKFQWRKCVEGNSLFRDTVIKNGEITPKGMTRMKEYKIHYTFSMPELLCMLDSFWGRGSSPLYFGHGQSVIVDGRKINYWTNVIDEWNSFYVGEDVEEIRFRGIQDKFCINVELRGMRTVRRNCKLKYLFVDPRFDSLLKMGHMYKNLKHIDAPKATINVCFTWNCPDLVVDCKKMVIPYCRKDFSITIWAKLIHAPIQFTFPIDCYRPIAVYCTIHTENLLNVINLPPDNLVQIDCGNAAFKSFYSRQISCTPHDELYKLFGYSFLCQENWQKGTSETGEDLEVTLAKRGVLWYRLPKELKIDISNILLSLESHIERPLEYAKPASNISSFPVCSHLYDFPRGIKAMSNLCKMNIKWNQTEVKSFYQMYENMYWSLKFFISGEENFRTKIEAYKPVYKYIRNNCKDGALWSNILDHMNLVMDGFRPDCKVPDSTYIKDTYINPFLRRLPYKDFKEKDVFINFIGLKVSYK